MSREVKRVELPTRPDLDVYVRALNSLESVSLANKLQAAKDTQEILVEQLVVFVCDVEGTPRFADVPAAHEFMKTIRPGVLTKIIRAATSFNELGDEQIEDERKN